MAHQQQIDFCKTVKQQLPHFFHNRLVVDIGSFDVNGNNQYLFDDCLYLGIDLLPGKNVDLATKGHELNLPNESLDVIVSTECFEHDQFYELTLQNIVRMLKPGGLFFFSCATTGRPEHGTRRSTPEDAPFIQKLGDWCDYYKNLEESDIRAALNIDTIFENYAFSVEIETSDLYFWGVKKGILDNRYDYSFQLQQSNLRLALKKNEDLLKECEEQISALNLALAERDAVLAECNAMLAERDLTLKLLISSKSWRLTKPLRFLKRILMRKNPLKNTSFKNADSL